MKNKILGILQGNAGERTFEEMGVSFAELTGRDPAIFLDIWKNPPKRYTYSQLVDLIMQKYGMGI